MALLQQYNHHKQKEVNFEIRIIDNKSKVDQLEIEFLNKD